MTIASKWRFAVDRGGTFTDVIGVDPAGEFHTMKLLSQSPDYDDASIEGIRTMLGLKRDVPLPQDQIEGIRFGTTVATNALLERKGGKVALLITQGFKNLLEIGYQDRPDIFKLCIRKTPPVYSTVIEVNERTDSNGGVIRDFDPAVLIHDIDELKKTETDALSIVFMHSWINPHHELLCELVLREQGFSNIFLSHKTVNQIKIVSRGQSTLVDAYLSVVLAQYLESIQKHTGQIPVEFMQSSGALSLPETFKGKNALLSGPAGGVVAVAAVANEKGIEGAIGFDMGGTSTDVSRFDGEFQKKYEQTVAGIPLQVEMMDIVNVAAGGGSILKFDGQKMTAGPESAGSYPGPACYGFGGPLTVTDANLMSGRVMADYFPETFGVNRNSSLNLEIAKARFLFLADEINRAMGTSMNVQDVAAGFLRVANEKMAMAIKEISVSRGFDIRNYALVCFGGAGGQHACPIATLLDIKRIIIHPLSGVMSAYGIGLAKPARKLSRTILKPYDIESNEELSNFFQELEGELFKEIKRRHEIYSVKRKIDLRPLGTERYLTLEYRGFKETVNAFKEQYERLFGLGPGDIPIETVNVKVEVQESDDFISSFIAADTLRVRVPEPVSYGKLYYPDGWANATVFRREALSAFTKIKGPALIIDSQFTVVVDPEFEAETDEAGIITMNKLSAQSNVQRTKSGKPDPVLLEVFNNIFMGIATEMGLTLKNTAYSVNMKERLDFSCAVFDSSGNLVANAPHIPVHLGSMADTVKAVIEDRGGTLRPGDIYLTNNPYRGGSHLSDMTVICPVFSEKGRPVFFTAARGHHSDVGGTTPGSMPPSASHIDEEGVLIDNFLLVRDNSIREYELKDILTHHTYPVRNITERISDFRSQIAACHKGMRELQHVIEKYGLNTVLDYMYYIQDNSEYSVKKALYRFIDVSGSFHSSFEDTLDDGTHVKASISIEGGSNPPETVKAVIDFSGTGKQHINDNLNAPASVTRSAVMYVLRSLIDRNVPLNSGCLKPVDIVIPKGTILSPEYPVPVASGNVETSQRVVDVLLGALEITAASQGTMNNLLFQVEGEPPYYETIAGGAGAMKDCPGASGVQVHMTNTRMTDPEVLEFRHPGVMLEQFTLRKGSGGKGEFPGGDGVVREIKYLKPAMVSIISERRSCAPYGVKGGEAGKRGNNLLKKADGDREMLGHREVLNIKNGESIIIETPGGGGYGEISKNKLKGFFGK